MNLQGGGDLLPNGLTPALPPLSVWALPNVPSSSAMSHDYIKVGAKFYQIDSLAGCTASGAPASQAGKALGDSSGAPGSCPCGDPISIGTGNLFEQVADYQTSGPEPARLHPLLQQPGRLQHLRHYARNELALELRPLSADRLGFLGHRREAGWPAGELHLDERRLDDRYRCGSQADQLRLNLDADRYTRYRRDLHVAAGASEALLQSHPRAQRLHADAAIRPGNQLTTVSDSFHRQLSFTYSGGKLQTVTTPDGLILTYGYTGALLTSVGYSTSPPTSQTYLYENTALPSALTGIIDENGNRYATWTYDSTGRALSSQHAGGAVTHQVSYNDTDGSRTVTNPLGEQEMYKFTTLQGVPKVTEIDRMASARPARGDSQVYLRQQRLHGEPDRLERQSSPAM